MKKRDSLGRKKITCHGILSLEKYFVSKFNSQNYNPKITLDSDILLLIAFRLFRAQTGTLQVNGKKIHRTQFSVYQTTRKWDRFSNRLCITRNAMTS